MQRVSALYADEHSRYAGLDRKCTRRVVLHSIGRYVDRQREREGREEPPRRTGALHSPSGYGRCSIAPDTKHQTRRARRTGWKAPSTLAGIAAGFGNDHRGGRRVQAAGLRRLPVRPREGSGRWLSVTRAAHLMQRELTAASAEGQRERLGWGFVRFSGAGGAISPRGARKRQRPSPAWAESPSRFKALPRARLHLPGRCPPGFESTWSWPFG